MARTVLFFHIIATAFGFHSEVPFVIVLHQVRRAVLICLSHMGHGIWGLNLQLLSPPIFAQGLMSVSLVLKPHLWVWALCFPWAESKLQTNQGGKNHLEKKFKWDQDHLNQTSAFTDILRGWCLLFLSQCLRMSLTPSFSLFLGANQELPKPRNSEHKVMLQTGHTFKEIWDFPSSN